MHNIDQLRDYPVVTPIDIRWGEQDPLGHVNNTVYFRWFEIARIEYLNRVDSNITMHGGGIGPILASIKCDFKKQLKFPDRVHVGTKVEHVGRTSVKVVHAVYSEQHQDIAALGESTLVIFDYNTNKPQRVSEPLRVEIARIQAACGS